MSIDALLKQLGSILDINQIQISGNRLLLDDGELLSAEVTPGRITIYYFGYHCHFFPDDGDPMVLARDFLAELLTTPLVRLDSHCGKKQVRYAWYFQRPGGVLEQIAEGWTSKSSPNPFARNTVTRSCWRYDKHAGRFVQVPDNVLQVLDFNWDLMATIRRSTDGVYSFTLDRNHFDEVLCDFVWSPLPIPDGTFRTEADAVKAVKTAAKQYLHALRRGTTNSRKM